MINIVDKIKCCGCGACIQKCPKNCISKEYDNEGFWYPQVDYQKCIDCGLCEKVCPCINIGDDKEPRNVYAAKAIDDDLRKKSSSGGVFSLLAKDILDSGGCVVGAAFNKEWLVDMICIHSEDELYKLRGSKYIQADTCNTFNEINIYLKEGKKVLYSGTPCQIKALKLFLSKDYENLYTVDVACHGVPSPGVWKKYLYEITGSLFKVSSKSEWSLSHDGNSLIKEINFREKSAGWRMFRVVLKYDSSHTKNKSISEISSVHNKNPYFEAFNRSLIIRPSCTKCLSKYGKSNSDLTIADFWGIENVLPQLDDDKGISLVLVNTSKGQQFFDKIDLNKVQCNYDDALLYNSGLRGSTKSHPKRYIFFKNYLDESSISSYINSLLKDRIHIRLKNIIKRILNKVFLLFKRCTRLH